MSLPSTLLNQFLSGRIHFCLISPGRTQKSGLLHAQHLPLLSLLQTESRAQQSWHLWCHLLVGEIAMASQNLPLWTCCWPYKSEPKFTEDMLGSCRCSASAGGEEMWRGTGIDQEYINVEEGACTVQPHPQRVQVSEPDSSEEQDGICNADVLEVELEFTL